MLEEDTRVLRSLHNNAAHDKMRIGGGCSLHADLVRHVTPSVADLGQPRFRSQQWRRQTTCYGL
jgi:hypothetical protein